MKRLVVAAMLLVAAPALAEPAPIGGAPARRVRDGDDAPWARGVSAERRDTAQRLLEEGNDLFLHARHTEALARYQQAIASWDHPAIRFNMVRALVYLDRPVEAYENLLLALRYGAAPLEDQVYAEAQGYERLLRGRIAELTVTCKQDEVAISVDGKSFLACPSRRTARILPGTHQIVGKRAGYLTTTRDVVVMPGARHSVDIRLPTFAEAATTERRWAPWKPWAVVGSGAAAVGLGVLLQLEARSDFAQYRDTLAIECALRPCHDDDIPPSARDLRDRARLEDRMSVGTMIVGGVAVVTGLALVILNRPYPVLPEQAPVPGLTIAPALTPDGVSAAVTGRF